MDTKDATCNGFFPLGFHLHTIFDEYPKHTMCPKNDTTCNFYSWANSEHINKFSKEQKDQFFQNLGKSFWDSIIKTSPGLEDFGSRFEKTVLSSIKKSTDEITKQILSSVTISKDDLFEGVFSTIEKSERRFTVNHLPYICVALASITAAPLFVYYIYKKAAYSIGRPELGIKNNQVSLLGRVYSATCNFFKLPTIKQKAEPIFNEVTANRIDAIKTSVKNIYKNNGYFQNLILYGPSGNGKTMVYESIAKHANMNSITMSGGDLAQYIKRGEHVSELNKLFSSITKPTILFIDEAEALAGNRKDLSAERLELQNAFLNLTSCQSKNVMLILATNVIEDIDPAILSRMDLKVSIKEPDLKERIAIVEMYANQFFDKKEVFKFFNESECKFIAEKTEGFTGRDIFKLINAIFITQAATNSNRLSKKIIYETLSDRLSQENEIKKLRDA